MELPPLFTGTKWSILQEICKAPKSPLELAETLQTSMANISQQLRLLEAAGILVKKRLSARDKGKPRTVYSLSQDSSFNISLTEGFSNRKLLKVNTHQKCTLRIWAINDSKVHYLFEKLYWILDSQINELNFLALSKQNSTLTILFVPKDKNLELKFPISISDLDNTLYKIKEKMANNDQLFSLDTSVFHIIYDPQNKFSGLKNEISSN